jgi:hypothetical protein
MSRADVQRALSSEASGQERIEHRYDREYGERE